jgi:UbiA prenyltransferase family
VPAGLLACALLMVNNLRDIRTDTLVGKRTLAVLLGDARSRMGYALMLLVPFGIAALLAFFRPLALITVAALPLARIPIRSVRAGATGPALVKALGETGRLQLAFGIAFTIGLAIRLLRTQLESGFAAGGFAVGDGSDGPAGPVRLVSPLVRKWAVVRPRSRRSCRPGDVTGFAWSIGAWRLIGCSGMHPINHGAWIHHNRAAASCTPARRCYPVTGGLTSSTL